MRSARPIIALAAAGIASAAIEHQFPRAVAQSGDDSTSTTTTTSTSTTWETITVTLVPTLRSTFSIPTSSFLGHTMTTSGSIAPSSLFPPETPVPPSTFSIPSGTPLGHTMTAPMLVHHQNNAEDDIASTIIQTIVVTMVAQPIITTYVSPPEAGFIDNHARTSKHDSTTASLSTLSPGQVERDYGSGPDGYGAGPGITISYATHTVTPAMVTVVMTGSLPPPATAYSYMTEPIATTPAIPGLPPGVTVVNVTVLSTVTSPPAGAVSAADVAGWSPTSLNSIDNSTSTTSYLNISTFSATGLNDLTWSSSSSGTTTCTSGSSANSKGVIAHTTTKLPSDFDVPSGRITAPMPGSGSSSGSSKTVDIGGLPVPVLMIVAMGACFALALFL